MLHATVFVTIHGATCCIQPVAYNNVVSCMVGLSQSYGDRYSTVCKQPGLPRVNPCTGVLQLDYPTIIIRLQTI